MRLCQKCKSSIGKGRSHKCNVSTLRKNLKEMFDDFDQGTREVVASNIVSAKFSFEKSSSVKLQTSGSNHLSLCCSSNENKNSPRIQFSSSQLNTLQLSLSTSNTNMKNKIIPFLRTVLGRKSVEQGCEIQFQKRDSRLEQFFSFTELDFQVSSTNELMPHPIIYCNDVEGLIASTCSARGIDMSEANIKIGIDGGGGFMKICLNIFTDDSSNDAHPRRKTPNEILNNSSVKKLIIIAISPDVKETYHNVKKILELLEIDLMAFEYTYALDLKLANIIAGIQAHGATYPCLWCECPKAKFALESSRSYPIRSLGSVRANAKSFNESKMSCKRTASKDYKNCVGEPLIYGEDQDIFYKELKKRNLRLQPQFVMNGSIRLASTAPRSTQVNLTATCASAL